MSNIKDRWKAFPDTIYDAIYLLPVIPLKQLTGYKWWRTIALVMLSYLYVIILLLIVVIASSYAMEWLGIKA